MISQSVLTKSTSMLGQIVLAYILLPEHFALISLTYTVTAFARVLENGGIREVLVYKGNESTCLTNASFWLSLFLGSCSFTLILTVSPFAAMLYQSNQVMHLLACLSIQPIITALATVPVAKLQTEHRFRSLAGFAAIQGISQTAFTVIFAYLDWGAFSFVIGSLLASIFHTSLVWAAHPVSIKAKPEFDLWPSLWKASVTLSLVGLTTSVIQQIDYMMLGIFHEKAVVGTYFFAFSVASQATHLLMNNIAMVFLPLLCKLQSEPERQLKAAIDAFRLLAGIGIPLSFIQCGLIAPAFHLFLPDKWLPSIPIAQILSLGLGLNVLSSLCWSLLKAQGKFKVILHLNSIGMIPFTIFVALAAAFGNSQIVAYVVLLWCSITSPLALWLSITKIGGKWLDVASIFLSPLVASISALSIALLSTTLVPESEHTQLYSATCISIVFPLTYTIILFTMGHPLLQEVSRIISKNAFLSKTIFQSGK